MRWKRRGREQGAGSGGQGAGDGGWEGRSEGKEIGSRISDIRYQKSEVRSQKPEVRGQKSEVRGQKSGGGFGPLISDLWPLVVCFLLFGDAGVVGAFEEVGADTTRTDSVTARSPMGALGRSMVVPGWGQWYNERPVKGVLIFSTELFLGGAMLYWDRRALDRRQRNTFFLWFLGVFFYNLADAYVDAHLYGFEEEAETVGLVRGNSEDRMPMIFMQVRF